MVKNKLLGALPKLSMSESADVEGGTQSEEVDLEWKNTLELHKAALSNSWKKAESIYKKTGMSYGVRITRRGETALHVSALAGHIDFVQNLVGKMSVDEIKIEMTNPRTGEKGDTAFHCAAILGDVKIAEIISQKDNITLEDLAMTTGFGDDLPICMAAFSGNKEMVKYLYKATKVRLFDPSQTSKGYLKTLLFTMIWRKLYEVALQMIKDLLEQGLAPKGMEERALIILAEKPLNPPRYQDRFIGFFQRQVREKNLVYKNGVELVKLLWDELLKNKHRALAVFNEDDNLIIEAAKHGNLVFISILIASYPDLIFEYDSDGNTIFHHAVLNRHVNIFKLINIGSIRPAITALDILKDEEGHNMLHLAGKLPPPSRLNVVPGAALQLQREMLWFEEVKKVMQPREVNRKIKLTRNDKTEEYTPHELFVKEHKGLMAEGEKWMRDTSNSCMIVAVLITTIAFAAAITVPGGNGDDGYPHFVSEYLFKIFAIADSISLISSATSLLNFLSILTARYTVDDFRWSLPNKLFIGLLTLFVSIVAMMVAFVLSIFIIFKNFTPPRITPLLVSVSSLPIILFIWQHLGLFFDVFRSTYTSRLLFKSKTDPNLLFK